MSDIEKPDVIGATRRAETIRIGMVGWAAAQDAIAEAFEAKDWVTLGYKSWGEYVEKEFAEKRLKLTRDQRSEAVEVFRLVGMSQREIAATLDVSRNTVAKDVAQSEPFADPLDAIPAAQDAVAAALADRSTPVDVPEEDHRDAKPGDEDGADARPSSAAQPQAGDVSNDTGSDETEPEDVAPRQSSGPVELPQEQPATGVSVAAPAGDPEHSGRSGEQGQAAVSVPAQETEAQQVKRELRERMTEQLLRSLVYLGRDFGPTPEAWFEGIYLPGAYKVLDMPGVRACLTPDSLRATAARIYEMADYMQETGRELR